MCPYVLRHLKVDLWGVTSSIPPVPMHQGYDESNDASRVVDRGGSPPAHYTKSLVTIDSAALGSSQKTATGNTSCKRSSHESRPDLECRLADRDFQVCAPHDGTATARHLPGQVRPGQGLQRGRPDGSHSGNTARSVTDHPASGPGGEGSGTFGPAYFDTRLSVGCWSASLDPAKTGTWMPSLNDQVVPRCADFGDHDLGDVDKKSMRAGRTVVIFHLGGGP